MSSFADGKIEAYVGPVELGAADNLEQVIVDFIAGAKQSLDIAIQELDSRTIAQAILVRSTDELRDEVQDWCAMRVQPVEALPPRRPVGQLHHLQGSNLVIGRGSAVPSQMANPVDFEVHAAVPSGSYIVPDPPPVVQDDDEGVFDEDRDL